MPGWKNETNGNDQNGLGNTQINTTNTFFMPIETENLKESIHDKLIAIPDVVNKLTERAFGVSGQSVKVLKGKESI